MSRLWQTLCRPGWIATVFTTLVLLAACEIPVCGCEPPFASHARVVGSVTAGSAPVSGATIRVTPSSAPSCGTAAQPLAGSLVPGVATSRVDGTFDIFIQSNSAPTITCVRVSAVRPLGAQQDSVAIAGVAISLRPIAAFPDSVRVTLAFP